MNYGGPYPTIMVFAGSKHEAREYIARFRKDDWSSNYIQVGSVVDFSREANAELHVTGTAYYKKNFDYVTHTALERRIPIKFDALHHGIITAPSLEIAHVFRKVLGISPEWEYES